MSTLQNIFSASIFGTMGLLLGMAVGAWRPVLALWVGEEVTDDAVARAEVMQTPPVTPFEPAMETPATPEPGDAPIAFTDDVPADLRPVALTDPLAEVAETCWPEATVRVDCDEVPCLAIVQDRETAPAPVEGCEAWQDRWDGPTAEVVEASLCPDGDIMHTRLVGPALPEDARPDHDTDPWHTARRLTARLERAQQTSGCASPRALHVENIPGYRLQCVPEGA